MNNAKLRGLIAEQYRTPTEMARAMGWRPDKLYSILRGTRKTTTDDVFDMAKALGILESHSEVVSIFIA